MVRFNESFERTKLQEPEGWDRQTSQQAQQAQNPQQTVGADQRAQRNGEAVKSPAPANPLVAMPGGHPQPGKPQHDRSLMPPPPPPDRFSNSTSAVTQPQEMRDRCGGFRHKQGRPFPFATTQSINPPGPGRLDPVIGSVGYGQGQVTPEEVAAQQANTRRLAAYNASVTEERIRREMERRLANQQRNAPVPFPSLPADFEQRQHVIRTWLHRKKALGQSTVEDRAALVLMGLRKEADEILDTEQEKK